MKTRLQGLSCHEITQMILAHTSIKPDWFFKELNSDTIYLLTEHICNVNGQFDKKERVSIIEFYHKIPDRINLDKILISILSKLDVVLTKKIIHFFDVAIMVQKHPLLSRKLERALIPYITKDTLCDMIILSLQTFNYCPEFIIKAIAPLYDFDINLIHGVMSNLMLRLSKMEQGSIYTTELYRTFLNVNVYISRIYNDYFDAIWFWKHGGTKYVTPIDVSWIFMYLDILSERIPENTINHTITIDPELYPYLSDHITVFQDKIFELFKKNGDISSLLWKLSPEECAVVTNLIMLDNICNFDNYETITRMIPSAGSYAVQRAFVQNGGDPTTIASDSGYLSTNNGVVDALRTIIKKPDDIAIKLMTKLCEDLNYSYLVWTHRDYIPRKFMGNFIKILLLNESLREYYIRDIAYSLPLEYITANLPEIIPYYRDDYTTEEIMFMISKERMSYIPIQYLTSQQMKDYIIHTSYYVWFISTDTDELYMEDLFTMNDVEDIICKHQRLEYLLNIQSDEYRTSIIEKYKEGLNDKTYTRQK